HDDVGYETIPLRWQPAALRTLLAEPISQAIARDHDLANDLAGGEIAHEALRAGVAERAIQGAADLAGETERAAVRFRNVDGLHLMGTLVYLLAGKPQEPFARAVRRDLLRHDLRSGQCEMLIESRAQLLGHVRHLGKVFRSAHVEPVPELLHAHFPLG